MLLLTHSIQEWWKLHSSIPQSSLVQISHLNRSSSHTSIWYRQEDKSITKEDEKMLSLIKHMIRGPPHFFSHTARTGLQLYFSTMQSQDNTLVNLLMHIHFILISCFLHINVSVLNTCHGNKSRLQYKLTLHCFSPDVSHTNNLWNFVTEGPIRGKSAPALSSFSTKDGKSHSRYLT